jgi:hypothetical protein
VSSTVLPHPRALDNPNPEPGEHRMCEKVCVPHDTRSERSIPKNIYMLVRLA